MLRVGILGCGSFAARHAELLSRKFVGVKLTAFCDVSEERAAAFAAKYGSPGAEIFTDHAALFAGAGLDAVFICLPPYGHTDEVEQAADRGIHVLIEKPIALSSEHAWRMVAAAEKAGITTQVGFMYRFGRAIELLKERLENGEAGMPGLMSTRYFCNSLHSPWWRERSKSGGQVVEQVIHMFDLMRYLLGEPASVFSRQENLFHRQTPGYTVEDVSVTVVSFRQGALGVAYATNSAIPGKWINDYKVVTQNVTAEFADANHATFTFTDQEGLPTLTVAADDDFYGREIEDFFAAIRSGGPTRTPIREGAKSLDLVLAAAASAEARKEIFLQER